ncbi:MAG: chemotaxis protein CheW [Steroidobacteraceae bacterium]
MSVVSANSLEQEAELLVGKVPGITKQMLTFVLGDETYGVDILRVQEIRGWQPVTRIPQSPRHVLGVLNLRGSIVPIVDLRMRLDFSSAEYTGVTVIIVMSIKSPVGQRDVGVVVDSVSDVVDVNTSNIKPAPDFGSRANTGYIQGLITIAERMVMLLDIDQLVVDDIISNAAMVA